MLSGHDTVLQEQLTRTAGANAELFFHPPYHKTRAIAFHEKSRNAPVAPGGINRGKNDVEPRFTPVARPELAPIQEIMIALQCGTGLQGKRIATRTGFREGIGTHRMPRQLGQVGSALGWRAPAEQRIGHEGVVHIYEYPDRRVDPRDFLDCQTGHEKAALRTSVLFRDLNAHAAKIEQLWAQYWIVLCFIVHPRHPRGNGRLRIIAYDGAKEGFLVAQDSQRPDHLGAWRVHIASSLQSGLLWPMWCDCTHFCARRLFASPTVHGLF